MSMERDFSRKQNWDIKITNVERLDIFVSWMSYLDYLKYKVSNFLMFCYQALLAV